jgi:DNA-binding transcriptional ArsR family regulator
MIQPPTHRYQLQVSSAAVAIRNPRRLRSGSITSRELPSGGSPLPKRSGAFIYNHMVVRRREREASLNQLFRALADGTRRDILARSLTETPSVSELAARYDMSFAAVQKHVAVLERAGLIQKRARGREQLVATNHARLQRAGELLDYYESIWRQRMAQLDDVLLAKGK